MQQQSQQQRIMRMPAVLATVGYSKSHLYELINRGEFPRPIKLGARAAGWLSGDISDWLDARIRASREGAAR